MNWITNSVLPKIKALVQPRSSRNLDGGALRGGLSPSVG